MPATSRTAAVLCAAFVLASAAQTPTPAKPLAFDVVSIRPSGTASCMSWSIQPDGLVAACLPLITVFYLAFPEDLAVADFFRNVPAWVTRDRFDLNARVAPEDLSLWQSSDQTRYHKPILEAMLQSFLADRCKLTFHRVPAEYPGQALVVDKRGVNFRPTDPAAPPITTGIKLGGGGRAVFTGQSRGHDEWAFHNATLDDLVGFLTDRGTVTRNRTNLTGRYDFVLTQIPYDPPDPAAGPAPPPPPAAYDLRSLGLRLDPIKITIQTVVIDHIEKPTEN